MSETVQLGVPLSSTILLNFTCKFPELSSTFAALRMPDLSQKLQKSLTVRPAWIRRIRTTKQNNFYRDNFKINPTPNTVGALIKDKLKILRPFLI